MFDKIVSLLGGSPLEAVKGIIQTFKLPPEQQLEFDKAMAKTEADIVTALARIDADDRASARQREVDTKDSRNVWLLAVGVTSGFFGTLGYMMMYPVPSGSERVIDVMLGSLGTAWIAVVSYYFGSSSSSSRKNDVIEKLVKHVNGE